MTESLDNTGAVVIKSKIRLLEKRVILFGNDSTLLCVDPSNVQATFYRLCPQTCVLVAVVAAGRIVAEVAALSAVAAVVAALYYYN